jgi:hypothetical protein
MERPYPPASLLELSDLSNFGIRMIPAPEVWEWLQAEILAYTGSIRNEDHAHMIDADIRVMWASSAFTKKGRTVVGQAEQVAFRAGGCGSGQQARRHSPNNCRRDPDCGWGDLLGYTFRCASDRCGYWLGRGGRKVTVQPTWYQAPVWPVEPPIPEIIAAPMLVAAETI